MSTEPEQQPYQHRIVKVRRVRDAIGAYCLDCQRVIADDCDPYWHWRKSQKIHERGSGHRNDYVQVDLKGQKDGDFLFLDK